MGTTTRNEAAERLRAYHDALGRANKVVDAKTLGDALAKYVAELIAIERRATVERIRSALKGRGFSPISEADMEWIGWRLDEEAAR